MTSTIRITGATAGIGAATARLFARNGWRVIGTGRRGDRLRALAEELGEAFLPLELDMRDTDALGHMAELAGDWGGVDLLLNNAGLAPPAEPLNEQDWERLGEVIETNITGLVALTRALSDGAPRCCPDLRITQTYEWTGGELRRTAIDEVPLDRE